MIYLQKRPVSMTLAGRIKYEKEWVYLNENAKSNKNSARPRISVPIFLFI